MKYIKLIIAIIIAGPIVTGQNLIFDEEILIEDYTPTEIIMPPSPLTTQVLFIGGYDIVETTPTYGNPQGRAVAKEWHDFIGWTPDYSGESMGWVSVNHEMVYEDDKIGDGGGMTAFRIKRAEDGSLEVMDQTLDDGRSGKFFNVDFVNTVGETGMNCGGINSANGRIWTAEEWYRSSTASIYNGNFRGADRPDSWNPHSPAPTAAGYGVRDTSFFTIDAPEFPLVDGMEIQKFENFNYMTEIDPKQAKAIRKQYNWGRAGWEGGAISKDGKYVYLGIDGSPAPWVRFTANTPYDFTDGVVSVYKQDNPQGQRWIDVPMDESNIFGGLTDYAWSVGATMFMRNEWVTIDPKTGIVYWTETGRDGSSGAGSRFLGVNGDNASAKPAAHHEIRAQERGQTTALSTDYQDYYGSVLYYDPRYETVGVVIEGGPYFSEEVSPSEAEYPAKHLSNPDGLSVMEIAGTSFLVIQEDLNGTSHGRTPAGISNPICELYLLQADLRNADIDDLVRITAIPAGAEITGAVQVSPNTLLINSQHPNANNPFPYNHSITFAIEGFADITTSTFDQPDFDESASISVYPNPTTRELHISENRDFAIYNIEGKRMKVFRNTNFADVSTFTPGTYFIKFSDTEVVKFIIQ